MDSLDPTPLQPQTSLDTTTPTPLNDDVVKSRAAKAEVGLGATTGQTADDIYRQISDGQEGAFRVAAATKIDAKDLQERQKRLAQAASTNQPLSMKDVDAILNGKPTNPDSVIEQGYGTALISKLKEASDRIEDNVITAAQAQDPEALQRYLDKGSTVSAIREYALKTAQDLDAEARNESLFSIPFPETFGGPIGIGSKTSPWSSALNWLTLGAYGGVRDEILMRGNTPNAGWTTGILEGNNLQAQSREILQSPTFEQAKDLIDRAVANIKYHSPADAQSWAASIAGMSTNEMITRDAMSGANILGAAGALKTIKSLLGSIGRAQVENISRPSRPAQAQNVNNPIPPSRQLTYQPDSLLAAQKAVEDVLRANVNPPTKANLAEAVGDTKEAAVQKAVVSAAEDNPQKDAVDTLFELHRANQKAITKDPGNSSREEHTRILDAGETFEKDAVDAIKETSKIVRLPVIAEEGFREVADRNVDLFKGKENTIVDVGMSHDSISNTDWHTYTIGNYSGRAFPSLQAAINHATINKYGRPNIIGTDPDVVYIPKHALFEQPFPISKPEEVQPRSNFVHEQDSKGQWSFWFDHPDGTRVEVMPSVEPEPTHIPFNTKTGKFGEPLAYGPHVVQKGLGYHIKWFVPLNEQDNWLRENHLIRAEPKVKLPSGKITKATAEELKLGAPILPATPRTISISSRKGPFNPFNDSFLAYFRLPQDTLSQAEVENRFKLVYGQNRYMNVVKKQMQYVENLFHGLIKDSGYVGKITDATVGNLTGRNRQLWNDFKRALTVAQKYPDPNTGLPGYYFRTPGELEHFWQTAFERSPSEAEKQAYFAIQRLDYMDWVFRNIAVFKNKARLGVMEHTLISNPVNSNSGEAVRSQPFEGRLLSKLPEGNIPAMIHYPDGSFRYYNGMNLKEKKAFREEFKESGWRSIQLYNPDTYPIKVKDKEGNPVRVVYVVSKSMESSPMTYKQVGYRGGGHWDYNYDNYIKQPIIRKFTVGGQTHWVYEGDATFAPIKSKVDGEIFISKLNEIRALLARKDIAKAKAVHQSYSDMEWKDFVKHFYPRKDKNGELVPSRFNLHEDFRIVPKGFTISEYDKNLISKYEGIEAAKRGKFIDAAKGQQSLARNFQVEYTGARDSHDIFEPVNTGTLQNPMYKFQPAELTDPLVSMTRALRRIVNSSMADDYKYTAVEHWLQENMDMLDARPNEVRGAPMYYFLKGELNRRFKNSPKGWAAETNRYNIKKLVGMPSMMDSQIQMWKQALADELFSTPKTGKALVKRAALVPAEWTLSHIGHPAQFIRGAAFHQTMGFWAWPQLFAQGAGFINVIAQSPDHAMAGMFGAWMHAWASLNRHPKILQGLGKLAEGLIGNPWKPGEWEEAFKNFQNSGFGSINNTMAIHDPQQKFLSSAGGVVLNKGTFFFDHAEMAVRMGSYYTAYHEFKRAYPNRKIGEVELGMIARRADDMYGNMGRNSKTILSSGALSVPLQFWKYIENVGQLFFSKRIGDVFGKENTFATRTQQRAQMLAMYYVMYGLGATGLTLLPINYYIRKYELAHGYVPGQSLMSTLLMEGPVSTLGAYISGHGDIGKGTYYNLNNRYGINGLQFFQDILEPNTTFWKMALGAGGSTLYRNLQSLSPFVKAWTSAYNNELNNPFRLTIKDWENGFRNINTFNSIDRFRYAIAFGKWLDRNGRPTEDIGKVDAILRTLLGTNDQKLDDDYIRHQIQSEQKEHYKQVGKDYLHYMQLQYEAIHNNDNEQAVAFGKNANWILQSGDVPVEEAAKIIAQTRNLLSNSHDITVDNFYNKLVPPSQEQERSKAYQEIQRQKQ